MARLAAGSRLPGLHELGIMSDWHYRRFNIELSRRGRTSAVLRKAIESLAEDGVARPADHQPDEGPFAS